MGAMQAATAGGLIDDVVAAVDIHRFAGDGPRRIMSEKRGRRPDIVDAHQAAAGAFAFVFSSSASIWGMPEEARVASGPGEIA